MFEQFSPQAAAGHNSGPPQQTYYLGSWSFIDFFWLAEVHPLEKPFDLDS